MTVISVINQKGGVGKTTTSINLGAELAKLGKDVLLIDLDSQGNATSGLGIGLPEGSYGIDNVLLNEVGVKSAVIKLEQAGFDVIPSDSSLAGIEQKLAGATARESVLKSCLEGLNYDYIIIDCPPSMGLLSVNALTASSHVLIPVQAEYYALEGLGQLLSLVQRVQETVNPSLRVLGLLLTMYDKRTSLATDVQKQLNEHFSDLLMETIIPRNIRLAEAPSHGLPISAYDKWSKGARAYKNLAKEVNKNV